MTLLNKYKNMILRDTPKRRDYVRKALKTGEL